jgi:hypothetical protein
MAKKLVVQRVEMKDRSMVFEMAVYWVSEMVVKTVYW